MNSSFIRTGKFLSLGCFYLFFSTLSLKLFLLGSYLEAEFGDCLALYTIFTIFRTSSQTSNSHNSKPIQEFIQLLLERAWNYEFDSAVPRMCDTPYTKIFPSKIAFL